MPRETFDFLIDRLATPAGEMIVIADAENNLRVIDWTEHEDRMKRLLDRQYGRGNWTLKPARDPGGLTSAMRRYFDGDHSVIDKLPVKTAGTPFQKTVWKTLRKIECGHTISYAELARRIGRPSAVRTVMAGFWEPAASGGGAAVALLPSWGRDPKKLSWQS